MIGQALVRISLVIILIVSAHFIRPFSINNFTNHFIESSKTFKSILPESQGARLDYANLLAITLNQILSTGKQREEGTGMDRSVAIAANSRFENHSCSNENDPPVKIRQPVILAKRAIRIESAKQAAELIHLSGETYQIEREVDVASIRKPVVTEVAIESDEALPTTYLKTSSPVILPVIRTSKSCNRLRLRPISAEPLKIIPNHYYLFHQPRKGDCEHREKKAVKIIALFNLDKPILSILGCERQENEPDAIVSEPANQEPNPTEMREAERLELFIPQPKGESCSID
jgi:hypothetical protein